MKLEITVERGRLEIDKRALKATMRAAASEIVLVSRRLASSANGSGRLYYGPGGSAREYRGGYKKIRYRASGPGQAPTRVTGTLARSIKASIYRSGEGFAVRDRAFYAKFLEAGAQGGAGSGKRGVKGKRNRRGAVVGTRVLAPRPFLSKALDQRSASLAKRIGESINSGVKFVKQRA